MYAEHVNFGNEKKEHVAWKRLGNTVLPPILNGTAIRTWNWTLN